MRNFYTALNSYFSQKSEIKLEGDDQYESAATVQKDFNRWFKEATVLIENLCYLPLVQQYHPRLVVAAYLQWVLEYQAKSQPI